MFAKRDRRAPQIGKADRPTHTVRSAHENPRKIAWDGNVQRPIEAPGPDAQDIIPIAKTEQVNASSPLHQPVDAGEEIDHEAGKIVGLTHRPNAAGGDSFMPIRRKWRNPQRSMATAW